MELAASTEASLARMELPMQCGLLFEENVPFAQSRFFRREDKNVITPNATNTAATVNPAVEISARE